MIPRVTAVIDPDAVEPVTSDQMVQWLSLPLGNPRISLLEDIIEEVRDLFERITGRVLIKKTLTIWYDALPGGQLPWWDGVKDGARTAEAGRSFDLINPPIYEVTSISTFDVDNVEYPWSDDNWYLDATDPEQIQRICLNIGAYWPTNVRPRNALKVVARAGYNNGDDNEDMPLPPAFRTAIKKMVAYVFNNPGDCTESGACACGAMNDIMPFILSDPMVRPETGRTRGLHSQFEGDFLE